MNLEKKSLPVVLIVGVALLLLLTSVGIAEVGQQGTPEGFEAEKVSSIPREAQDAMAVLAAPRNQSDSLATPLSEELSEQADFGMNPDLSRLSIGNATHSVYAVPADDRVCVVLTVGEGGNVTCSPTADVADGTAAPTTVGIENGSVAVVGLVPDGVESVSLTTDRGTRQISVQDNAYYTVVPAGTMVRSIGIDGPSGLQSFAISDPLSALGNAENE